MVYETLAIKMQSTMQKPLRTPVVSNFLLSFKNSPAFQESESAGKPIREK